MRRFILAMSVLALVLGATCGDAFATYIDSALCIPSGVNTRCFRKSSSGMPLTFSTIIPAIT